MHRIRYTYSSYIWASEEENPDEDHGWYSPGWGELSSYNSDGSFITNEEFMANCDSATYDLEGDVYCDVCITNGHYDYGDGIWTMPDVNSMAHIPERSVIEFFVDELEEYGCCFDNDRWFSSDTTCVDFRTGKMREISIHPVEEDWSEQELEDIRKEINRRAAARKEGYMW